MELLSLKFIIFLVLSLCAYYAMHKFAPQKQWIILLAVSMIFYSWAGLKNFIFIFITAFTVYAGTSIIQRLSDKYLAAKSNCTNKDELKLLKSALQNKKRIVLYSVLFINFGILAYIKYWNTIFEGVASLFKITGEFHLYRILLPLGISFYMFQSAGYLIDVYNGKCKAERNFLKFLLFVSFFPQLIQGPINRFDQISSTLYEPHSFDWERTKKSLFLILFGTLKKYAIANLLSGSLSQIFDAPKADTPGSTIVFGILLYSIQEYADFSGGIDMVTGAAGLFGVKMMKNFRQPYFSTSLGDFWRRWHISLGAWMRDYIFYPLALTKPMQNLAKTCGTKFGKNLSRTIPAGIANIVVFFVVGLWHGAELHFIVWGLYNGLVIAMSDILSPVFSRITGALKIPVASKPFHIFRILRTFIIVGIGRYFDRIGSIKDCMIFFKNTICNFQFDMMFSFDPEFIHKRIMLMVLFLAMIFVFINSLLEESDKNMYDLLRSTNTAARWSVYYFLIFLTLASFMPIGLTAGGFLYANF